MISYHFFGQGLARKSSSGQSPPTSKRMVSGDLVCALAFGMILAAATLVQGQTHSVEYIDLGRERVPLYLPSTYDASEPLPLIVALHGYGMNGPVIENYFNLIQQVDSKRFLYCLPEGTLNSKGSRFWNATNACCDFGQPGSNVDDSTYLIKLIELIRDQYAVDNLSIHFMGYSNGGYMSYRMACDHADIIASVLSLSGMTYLNVSHCSPSEAVSVLHVHGTDDDLVLFDGGCLFNSNRFCYPGALQTAGSWASYNGCDPVAPDAGEAFDLDRSIPGTETTISIYNQNCNAGVSVEMWTMQGSGHMPMFRGPDEGPTDNRFAQRAVDWLLSHRKGQEVTDRDVLISLYNEKEGGAVPTNQAGKLPQF